MAQDLTRDNELHWVKRELARVHKEREMLLDALVVATAPSPFRHEREEHRGRILATLAAAIAIEESSEL